MNCFKCIKSSTYDDPSTHCWLARCSCLGTAEVVGCFDDPDDPGDAPVWDVDLGRSNQYCIANTGKQDGLEPVWLSAEAMRDAAALLGGEPDGMIICGSKEPLKDENEKEINE